MPGPAPHFPGDVQVALCEHREVCFLEFQEQKFTLGPSLEDVSGLYVQTEFCPHLLQLTCFALRDIILEW